MKNKKEFISAFIGLLYSWGGDTPPEAIWAANDILKWIDLEYGKKCPLEFLEDDQIGQNDQVINWLNTNL